MNIHKVHVEQTKNNVALKSLEKQLVRLYHSTRSQKKRPSFDGLFLLSSHPEGENQC